MLDNLTHPATHTHTHTHTHTCPTTHPTHTHCISKWNDEDNTFRIKTGNKFFTKVQYP